MTRPYFYLALLLCLFNLSSVAQPANETSNTQDAELKFVVYVSRHGVRSPTGKLEQYNLYSTAAWPGWDVAPGYLTRHGYQLMELFGAYDRTQLAGEGLWHTTGCEDAAHVTIHTDSDQRTRETGKALAAGLFPGCNTNISFLPQGVPDPLFHSISAGIGHAETDLASAAVLGRIGGDPNNLTNTYRAQIAALEQILSTCGTPAPRTAKRISLFDVTAKLSPGREERFADLRGPLNTASTLTENILLEYSQGMDASNVGWGCVDGSKVRSLIDLHTAATDFTQRTKIIAQTQASNLLDHIRRAMEQAATGKSIAGAPSAPEDSALFLVGHDTNLENIGGVLNLNWIADGRRDDTPPGSALVFELWKTRSTGSYFVQTYYTAQSLEQMRLASPLSLENPPERVHLFLPGCSQKDLSCSWSQFAEMLKQAIDPRNVDSH